MRIKNTALFFVTINMYNLSMASDFDASQLQQKLHIYESYYVSKQNHQHRIGLHIGLSEERALLECEKALILGEFFREVRKQKGEMYFNDLHCKKLK